MTKERDLNLDIENGHGEVYFVAHRYNVDPKNMEKRVRVFINQLLPGIVVAAQTEDEIKFAFEVLGRHAHRFGFKLIEEDMPDEYLMVLIAVSETVTALLIKQKELREHGRDRIAEIPR